MNIKITKPHNVKSYHALPKSEREQWGFYIEPKAYLVDFLEKHDSFDEYYLKEYPIQAFFRITVNDFFMYRYYSVKHTWRRFKQSLRSENHSTVKLVPREWIDKSELIPHMILQMTLDFRKEANESMVDYEHNEEQREFKKWLDKTCHVIEKVIPYVEKRQDRSYKELKKDEQDYHTKYKYVNKWEAYQTKLVRDVCKDIITKLDHFWT